jgi:hypothetical protein
VSVSGNIPPDLVPLSLSVFSQSSNQRHTSRTLKSAKPNLPPSTAAATAHPPTNTSGSKFRAASESPRGSAPLPPPPPLTLPARAPPRVSPPHRHCRSPRGGGGFRPPPLDPRRICSCEFLAAGFFLWLWELQLGRSCRLRGLDRPLWAVSPQCRAGPAKIARVLRADFAGER